MDHRADIYALGVVFYQMLTGELPGKTIAPPSTKVLIDVRLDEVVLRALEKKPELRYQQVSQVKTCVETIAGTPETGSSRCESENESSVRGLGGLSLFRSILDWCWGFLICWLLFLLLTGKHERSTWIYFLCNAGLLVLASAIEYGLRQRRHRRTPKVRDHPRSRGRESVPSEPGRETDDLRRLTSATTSRKLTGLQIFFRSLAVGAFVWLLVFALAAAVSSLLPRSYAATACVKIARSGTTQGFDPYFLQTEFERMDSFEFLKQVAVTADLKTHWKDSLFGNESEQAEQMAIRLRGAMELRPRRSTDLVEIRFHSEAPGEAAEIANAIASVYCEQSKAEIVEHATPPLRPIRPNPFLNLAICVFGGALIGLIAGGLTALYLKAKNRLTPSNSKREPAPSESPSHPTIPMPSNVWRKLRIVAALFIFVGVWSLADVLFSNGDRNITIMPGALLLPLGIGLLNRREFCRRAAVWCVWARFVFMLFMLGWLFGKAFGLFSGWDVVAKILGQPINSTGGAMLTFVFFVGEVVLLPWMFLILMRADVRSAFAHAQNKPRPLVEWGMTVLVLLIMLCPQVRLPFENRLRTGIYFTNLKPAAITQKNEQNFGPVMERVWTNAAMIDFDSGKVFADLPQPVAKEDIRPAFEKMAKEGLDLGYFQSEGAFCAGMKVKSLKATDWSNITADTLAYALTESPDYDMTRTLNAGAGGLNYGNNIPFVYGFQTREGGRGLLQITGFTENPRGVKIRYKLVQNHVSTGKLSTEPSDLREARAKLAELKVSLCELHPDVKTAEAIVSEMDRLAREEPTAPADLRAAKINFVRMRMEYGEAYPHTKTALSRVKEIERILKDEPNTPPDLREAKAHLIELLEEVGPQHPTFKKALTRIAEFERMTNEEPTASAELREAKARLVEIRIEYGNQHPLVQQALARIQVLEGK